MSEQCLVNMPGPEVWKPLLEEIMKLELTPIVMVTIIPETIFYLSSIDIALVIG